MTLTSAMRLTSAHDKHPSADRLAAQCRSQQVRGEPRLGRGVDHTGRVLQLPPINQVGNSVHWDSPC